MTRDKLLIQAAAELIIEKPDQTDQILEGLKKILTRRGRTHFSAVTEKVKEVVAELQNVNRYKVTSAQPLNDADKEQLSMIVNDPTSDIDYNTNTRLLGGVTIKTKDKMLDMSIRNKLEKIKSAIA